MIISNGKEPFAIHGLRKYNLTLEGLKKNAEHLNDK